MGAEEAESTSGPEVCVGVLIHYTLSTSLGLFKNIFSNASDASESPTLKNIEQLISQSPQDLKYFQAFYDGVKTATDQEGALFIVAVGVGVKNPRHYLVLPHPEEASHQTISLSNCTIPVVSSATALSKAQLRWPTLPGAASVFHDFFPVANQWRATNGASFKHVLLVSIINSKNLEAFTKVSSDSAPAKNLDLAFLVLCPEKGEKPNVEGMEALEHFATDMDPRIKTELAAMGYKSPNKMVLVCDSMEEVRKVWVAFRNNFGNSREITTPFKPSDLHSLQKVAIDEDIINLIVPNLPNIKVHFQAISQQSLNENDWNVISNSSVAVSELLQRVYEKKAVKKLGQTLFIVVPKVMDHIKDNNKQAYVLLH